VELHGSWGWESQARIVNGSSSSSKSSKSSSSSSSSSKSKNKIKQKQNRHVLENLYQANIKLNAHKTNLRRFRIQRFFRFNLIKK